MTTLTLLPASVEFAAELYQFELENRAFFESRINARPASYYALDAVSKALQQAEHDAKSDVGYQFFMCDNALNMVGRINLTRVRRAHFHSAELGYRIAEWACGKGYATEAIRQMLHKAFLDLELKRIEAAVSVSNHASVRALQRNGFAQYGHAKRSFELNGHWYDVLHFEAHASAVCLRSLG